MNFGSPVGRRRFAVAEGQQRAAVALARDPEAEPREYRGHRVDGLGERVDDRAARAIGRAVGIADDHRNAKALVEVTDLADKMMIAKLLAVIAGEDDQR